MDLPQFIERSQLAFFHACIIYVLESSKVSTKQMQLKTLAFTVVDPTTIAHMKPIMRCSPRSPRIRRNVTKFSIVLPPIWRQIELELNKPPQTSELYRIQLRTLSYDDSLQLSESQPDGLSLVGAVELCCNYSDLDCDA
ncbi:hypothetical protein SS50377_26242 [Spironucleus salmonicida]|uniref:Uncharacterized protein n=1 Tax=Spironucleus salmonicida TaxID=348837 RepID=A0A9P8LPW0_9EUKA|nr:hypothetical protein SS50377_26242 [Spironucleus salmonicida]